MTIKLNGPLGRCVVASALGAVIVISFVPTAMAQWAPAWGAPFPGDIERSLDAQGYVLIGPLMRRPGVYIADVVAGVAGQERLIIDARSGQVLERFPATGRNRAFAAGDEGFGEPRGGGFGAPLNSGQANFHTPTAVAPYGVGEPRAGTKAKPKSVAAERKAAIINPPLPPPAPRETAKADGSGSGALQPTENLKPDQPRISSAPAETGTQPSASAPRDLATAASDKPKVSIVPAGMFQ